MNYRILLLLGIAFFSCGKKSENQSSSMTETTTAPQSQTRTEENDLDLATQLGEEDDEARYLNTEKTGDGSKIVLNERFAFSIKIPEHWRAIDKSKNGDGYYLYFEENQTADVRIFAERIDPDMADIYAIDCIENTNFTTEEKLIGIRCVGKDFVSYYIEKENIRIQLYIKGWDELSIVNKSNINAVAASMLFQTQSDNHKA